MANRFFSFGWGLLLAGCAVVTNSAFGAYLPQLGPSPLRFRALPAFAATAAIFPSLRMDDSASPTNATLVNPAPNPAPADNLEPFGPSLPAEIADSGATNSVTQPASAQPLVVLDGTLRITPQMLVDFFKPVPNGTNAALMTAPAGSFTPPLPPSSSATYKSN